MRLFGSLQKSKGPNNAPVKTLRCTPDIVHEVSYDHSTGALANPRINPIADEAAHYWYMYVERCVQKPLAAQRLLGREFVQPSPPNSMVSPLFLPILCPGTPIPDFPRVKSLKSVLFSIQNFQTLHSISFSVTILSLPLLYNKTLQKQIIKKEKKILVLFIFIYNIYLYIYL